MELYKIADNYCRVLNNIGDSFDSECIKNTLDGMEDEFSEKAINVAAYIKRQEKKIIAMSNYEKEVSNNRRALQNKNEHLKRYIRDNMEKCEIKKIEGVEFNISIRRCPSSVVIECEDSIPDEYISNVIKNFNKVKIKEFINNGIKIDGVKLETKNSLTIK